MLAAAVLAAGLLLPYVGGLGLAARHESAKFLNTSCNLQETQPPQPTTFYASDGKTVIARICSRRTASRSRSARFPRMLVKALVATEDRRFYSHHGVDMRGLLRSAVSNAGGATQGGSTLTMQYVKQIRYYQAGQDVAKQQAAIDQNLNRKIEDAKCAIYIESVKDESKDTILDNYLNIAFFGENSYGIETRRADLLQQARSSQLTLPESALLVGLLRAPSRVRPVPEPGRGQDPPQRGAAEPRRRPRHLARPRPTSTRRHPSRLATTSAPVVREGCANANPKIPNAGFFCDYAKAWLENTQGITDLSHRRLQDRHDAERRPAERRAAQSLVGVPRDRADDGRRARRRSAHRQRLVDGDQQALRHEPRRRRTSRHTVCPNFTNYTASGASTYKLFSLLTALQTGVPDSWTLGTNARRQGLHARPTATAARSPARTATPTSVTTSTRVCARATAKSSNTFFVGMDDTLFACDLQPIVDMALKLGMNGLKQPIESGSKQTLAQEIVSNQYVLPIALGSGLGTSPLELAGAYAAIANGGKFNAPAPIVSITDETGQPVSVKRTPAVRVVSPQVAAQAVDILAGDTHRRRHVRAGQFQSWYSQNGSMVAGKTGTAVNGGAGTKNSALWFVGMTPTLVATTAIINPSAPSNPIPSLPGI